MGAIKSDYHQLVELVGFNCPGLVNSAGIIAILQQVLFPSPQAVPSVAITLLVAKVLDPTAQTTERQVSWLQVPNEESLPEEVKAIFQAQRAYQGFVHSYFEGFSLNPDHLLRWFNYYDALMHGKGELSRRERELIAVVVSATNHCESCVITHQVQLQEVTGDRDHYG